MNSQRWNIKNFLNSFYHRPCIILSKYKSVFIRNCGKCLAIVTVSLGHSRSIIVVTIGSEVESLLKVDRGRSWRRSGGIDPKNVCQLLGQTRDAWLAGSRSLSIYLPACSSSSYVLLPTYDPLTCVDAYPLGAHVEPRLSETIRESENVLRNRVDFFRNLKVAKLRLITRAP